MASTSQVIRGVSVAAQLSWLSSKSQKPSMCLFSSLDSECLRCMNISCVFVCVHVCLYVCVFACVLSSTSIQQVKSESAGCSVIFRPHGPQPTRPLCPWDSPGKNTGVGSHVLLQGIFPTRALNPGPLHCILYRLSHQGSLTFDLVDLQKPQFPVVQSNVSLGMCVFYITFQKHLFF